LYKKQKTALAGKLVEYNSSIMSKLKLVLHTVIFSIFIFGIIIVFSCGNIAHEAKADYLRLPNKDSINTILREIHAEEKAKKLEALYNQKTKYGFNGCVLIAQKGHILYKGAHGYANFKTKQPLKINTAFQLASASKPFTAAAILMLMERGQLHLSDKVTCFIPDFPYPDIDIYMLLTHRSGLNNYVYFSVPYCENYKSYKGGIYDNNAVLDIMRNTKPAPFCPPDKKFGYCNTNYVILASIVEKVSGQSFHDFMRENIFAPLKMNNTWVRTPNSFAHHSNVAVGHTVAKRLDQNTYADDVVGDKGIYSTIEDLLKWDQALYSDKLLKQETLEKAFTGYSKEHGGKKNYGLGWRITEHQKDKKDIYHNGWWHGFNTTFFRRPSDEITIIVLSNINNKKAYLINDVLQVIDNKFYPSEMSPSETGSEEI
jgi:CubicO group peptidase (beta-lactamase class C family)